MYQRSRFIKIAICCFFLFANTSQVISQGRKKLRDSQAGLGGRAMKGHVILPEELQKIKDAIPTNATAKPTQPRKLLVFTLCKGFVHSSIPYATKALEIMGKKTGAFEIVQSEDMSMFKPENLENFDAIFFNSCSELAFEDSVKGGKGLAGIHGATINFHTWPEAAEMMGGIFDRHPWSKRGNWAVKIDDPDHRLTAAFNGRDFKINDEIFRIGAPFSRDKVRVLLSLDMKDETNLNVNDIRPTDRDIPISWIRNFGKGRVFYCSLGHNHHIFWNPRVLQHYLDGIQFALGDLKVDATPSVERKLGRNCCL
jgi:type 1 glutamine amidotransferase